MKLTDLLIFEEDLQLEKKTVVILRWIALIGQLLTIFTVHFILNFKLPLVFCSITIFCGGLTNIFIQYKFKKTNYQILSQQYFFFMTLFSYQY